MGALLRIRDLRIGFGRAEALHGIDLTVGEGARVGIIGESGSGKSVTALATMGLLPDTARVSGSIELGGRQLVGLSDTGFARLRGDVVSMIFQEPMTALDPTMRVGRQVAEVLRLHQGAPAGRARERVIEMLSQVGLPDPERISMSFPHQLSGGQRQRALIAMALINQPELVICDEPTTALDVTVQARVLRLLDEQLDAAGAACLFISHDLAVVSQVCDEVLVMYRGTIVESGPIAQVLENPRHPYTAGLIATARIDQIEPGRPLPVIENFWDGKEGRP
ncbi:MAG: ABC transporter ATP-binding protein [Propionibacteriaceae bacterium]|nr:ABC transporter ATP-binding protein [Propionibacteriaceae bacterium]